MSKEITDRQRLESFDVLLKNISQRLFVFKKDCRVLPDFLETIDDCFPRPIVGENVLEVLFKWGIASNNTAGFQEDQDLSMLQELLASVFERITDLDVMIELLPAQIILQNKTFALCYSYIQSSNGLDEDRIMVVMNEITSQKNLENRILIEKERCLMVIKVALDSDGYFQFRQSVESAHPDFSAELKKDHKEIQLGKILHFISMFKGGAEIYDINEIIPICEGILKELQEVQQQDEFKEEQLEQLRSLAVELYEKFDLLHNRYLGDFTSDEQILDHKIYSITDEKLRNIKGDIVDRLLTTKFKQLDSLIEKTLIPSINDAQLSEVANQNLEQIRGGIQEDIEKVLCQEIVKLLEGLKNRRIGLALKKMALITKNLGDRLGKQVEIVTSGDDIEIDYHRFGDLFGSIIHLLRNCVEHGLETMEERVFLGKSLEGKVSISVNLEDDVLSLSIEDDGKGFDLDMIKATVLKRKLIAKGEIEKLSDEGILDLIYKSGFSSKAIVNSIAEKGVGLTAVNKTIESMGGKMSIKTKKEEGSRFEIKIPLKTESSLTHQL
ncbi:MAG: hypothetical protein GY786_19270 [Proteobacteria bacterium]|nr:hypothetical protein [Pseudomonadota bacterium]